MFVVLWDEITHKEKKGTKLYRHQSIKLTMTHEQL